MPNEKTGTMTLKVLGRILEFNCFGDLLKETIKWSAAEEVYKAYPNQMYVNPSYTRIRAKIKAPHKPTKPIK